jgi:antitoxin VapB
MSTTKRAKLFLNGRSQAVRLPAEFRFPGEEVYIRRDSKTGDVILSARPKNWDSFYRLRGEIDVPDEFMAERGDGPPQKRKLF